VYLAGADELVDEREREREIERAIERERERERERGGRTLPSRTSWSMARSCSSMGTVA
jgi:hypothetical protein